MDRKGKVEGSDAGRIVGGLIVLSIGVVLLLDRMGVAEVAFDGRYWPFIPMLIGVVRFLYPPPSGSPRGGAWLIWVGLWGYVSEFHVMGFDFTTSWPLLIIGAGVGVIWGALEGPRDCRQVRS
jgi:hypothetical protein